MSFYSAKIESAKVPENVTSCPRPPSPLPHLSSLRKWQYRTTRQLSKKTPSLEQIRAILEACTYRGKEEESGADREQLGKCTLAELQVKRHACARSCVRGGGGRRQYVL